MDRERSRKIRDIALYFLFYSFAGWCYECLFLCPIREHQIVNRGYLFGPWLPIYGAGALLLLALLNRARKRPVRVGGVNIRPLLVFCAVLVLTTGVELAATYLIGLAGKDFSALWYYGSYRFNFQGRIALWPSVRFGIIGMIVLYLIQPLLERLLEGPARQKKIDAVFVLLGVLFLADLLARIWLGSNFTA